MEMFNGDQHGLPDDVVLFPNTTTNLPSFTLSTTTSSSNHNHISKINFIPPQPPQKLRPIRSNVRTSWQQPTTTDDDVDAFYNNNTESDTTGGFITPNATEEVSNLILLSKQCQIQAAALSCSPDETNKLQEAIKEPINKKKKKKKRKRKSRKRLQLLIKGMMHTVMEKQEQMHRQLIDLLKKKENESIMREEAWKKQEMERAKRDEQARSQELSRNLALITFIQNTFGQETQIFNRLHATNFVKQVENQKEETLKCDAGNNGVKVNNVEESKHNSNITRWPKSEVQALITVRAAVNQKLNETGSKGFMWVEVAAGLSGMGYNRTPKKCKEKWDNINKYYRRKVEKGTASKSQVCTYFKELEMLNKNKSVSANSHDEDHSTKSLP